MRENGEKLQISEYHCTQQGRTSRVTMGTGKVGQDGWDRLYQLPDVALETLSRPQRQREGCDDWIPLVEEKHQLFSLTFGPWASCTCTPAGATSQGKSWTSSVDREMHLNLLYTVQIAATLPYKTQFRIREMFYFLKCVSPASDTLEWGRALEGPFSEVLVYSMRILHGECYEEESLTGRVCPDKMCPKCSPSKVLVWHCKRWRQETDLMQNVRLGLRNNNLCIYLTSCLLMLVSWVRFQCVISWVRFQCVISCSCVLSPLVTHLAHHPSPASTSLWSPLVLTAHHTAGECAVYCNHIIPRSHHTYHQMVHIIQVFFLNFVVVYYCRRMCSLLLLLWFLQAFHILHQILLLLFTCCLFVVCSHVFLYFCCCLLAACLLFVLMFYTKVCCCLLVVC